jgi:hypothetical protein
VIPAVNCYFSAYAAEPGALGVEPLKAAIGLAGAPPGRLKAARGYSSLVRIQLRIRFVSYTGEECRVAFCGFNSVA